MPGTEERVEMGGLDPEGTYHFALRAWDAGNYRSPISNQVQVEVK